MSLTTEVSIDQITVTENGTVLVREVTKVMDGDVEVNRTYHRTSLSPGDDISRQNQQVQTIANNAWTSEIISAYQSNLTRTQV
jgi:hypothetical protein